jgi:hypothetical protein
MTKPRSRRKQKNIVYQGLSDNSALDTLTKSTWDAVHQAKKIKYLSSYKELINNLPKKDMQELSNIVKEEYEKYYIWPKGK